MKRIFEVIPGFDCYYGKCRSKGCPGKKGNAGDGHGIHGDEWYYGVVSDDGLTCLTLTLYTSDFPETVPKDHQERRGLRCRKCPHWGHHKKCDVRFSNILVQCNCPAEIPHGADLTLHTQFLTDGAEFQVPGRTMPGGFVCNNDYMTTSLGARDFYDKYGVHVKEQNENFWGALEGRFVILDKEARAARSGPSKTRWDRIVEEIKS